MSMIIRSAPSTEDTVDRIHPEHGRRRATHTVDKPVTSLPGLDSPRLQILGPLRLWRGEAELDAGPRQQA
ncbi:hypothetical protein, partial [Catellatospora coxensis]